MRARRELDLLRVKVALLTRGVALPPTEPGGRRGGAGPTGGRYFLLEGESVVNAPVRRGEQATRMGALTLEEQGGERFRLHGLKGVEEAALGVEMIPSPLFYGERLRDGTPMYQVALVHGTDCLATTIVQSCHYFQLGEECHFCSLPVSLALGRTILRKTPEQFLEVLRAARREGRASHVTLTIGSPDRPDRGADDYIKFVSEVRRNSDIPIHAQLEPPRPLSLLEEMKEAGVDTVGIHLELFDDGLRGRYCPGKSRYAGWREYLECWRRAVEVFGPAQVSTFILLGLGEKVDRLREGMEECARMGVLPLLVPFRPNPGSRLERFTPTYTGRLDGVVKLYLECASILHRYGLDPAESLAGCARCAGCTALPEAYRAVEAGASPP